MHDNFFLFLWLKSYLYLNQEIVNRNTKLGSNLKQNF